MQKISEKSVKVNVKSKCKSVTFRGENLSQEENFADFAVFAKIPEIKFPQNSTKSSIHEIKFLRNFTKLMNRETKLGNRWIS